MNKPCSSAMIMNPDSQKELPADISDGLPKCTTPPRRSARVRYQAIHLSADNASNTKFRSSTSTLKPNLPNLKPKSKIKKRGTHSPRTRRPKPVPPNGSMSRPVPALTFKRHRHRHPRDSSTSNPSGTTLPSWSSDPAMRSPPSSQAKELLHLAKEAANLDLECLGRRPFIMDLILDTKPTITKYREDILMDALEETKQRFYPKADYSFRKPSDLRKYWSEQEELWRNVPLDLGDSLDFSPKKLYHVSAERTTAWNSTFDDMGGEHSQPEGCSMTCSPPDGPTYLSPRTSDGSYEEKHIERFNGLFSGQGTGFSSEFSAHGYSHS